LKCFDFPNTTQGKFSSFAIQTIDFLSLLFPRMNNVLKYERLISFGRIDPSSLTPVLKALVYPQRVGNIMAKMLSICGVIREEGLTSASSFSDRLTGRLRD
jgi:hypothetical protein